MKTLLADPRIREQAQRESILKRLRGCIAKESTIFSEYFPPMFAEDVCLNVGALLECFDNDGQDSVTLNVFRLAKRLADCLEGKAF